MTDAFAKKLVSVLLSAAVLWAEAGTVLGQEHGQGDSLIEVARYLQRAEEELNCSTTEAGKWTSVATNALGQYRAVSQSDRGAVAMLRVRMTFLRNDIDVRQKLVKQAAGNTERLVAAKRLSSAQRVIEDVTTKASTCDARIRRLQLEIGQSLAEADRLVHAGDERANVDHKQAIRLYEAAIAINIEQPGVAARIESVRAASRHGHPVVKKVFWITLTMALAAGAAYEGEQYYEQRQRKLASSTGTKTAVAVVRPR